MLSGFEQEEQAVDVKAIRDDVETALRHEDETGALRAMVERAVRTRREIDADEVARLVSGGVAMLREFVASAPTIVEATIAAAQDAGVVEEVRPIFETALSYTREEIDFIPDRLGLAGLLDDAYLIYGLMQEISERHRIMTGTGLLPSSAFSEMQQVKRLIGDPTATRLDVAIVAFSRRQNVRETIEQILGRIGDQGLAMDLPARVGMTGERSLLADIPPLDLGQAERG